MRSLKSFCKRINKHTFSQHPRMSTQELTLQEARPPYRFGRQGAHYTMYATISSLPFLYHPPP
jgi:hypothetical protein